MNPRTTIIRISILALALACSGMAFAESGAIEPVEAKVMAKSGQADAVQKGSAKMTQSKMASGEQKQLKSQNRDATKMGTQGTAKQQKASKGEAQGAAKQQKASKGEAQGTAKQQKASKGEAQGTAKQRKASKGPTSLREATRASDRSRIRESRKDHGSMAERGTRAGAGEKRQSETAEHRQERRGAASGSSGAADRASGSGNGARSGGKS